MNGTDPRDSLGSRPHRREFWVVAFAFLAAYVGISLPVVGAGITLARHVTPKVTILGFGITITVGIAAAAITLLRRPRTHAGVDPAAATRAKDAPDGTPGRDPIPN